MINKNIFKKKYGRPKLIEKISQKLIEILVLNLSSKHIENKRKQLAVFSYDYIALRINIDGVYEIEELDTLFSWLSEFKIDLFNGIALDIGANIGNHSLYFSDYYKKVYSFEPVKRTYELLSINSKLAKNIQCINIGLSDKNREACISINPTNFGGAEIGNKETLYSEKITLKKLDSVIDKDENIKMMKIDVEGHEYEVLIGAEKIIEINKPIILFEQHNNDFINGESKAINQLKKYGYSQFYVLQKKPKSIIKINGFINTFLTVLNRIIFGSEMQINYQENLKPDFYPFIIAVPNWIKSEDNKAI